MLELAGVEIHRETELTEFGGIKFAFGPKVFIHPSFALSLKDLKAKFPAGSKIHKEATLVLAGRNSTIEKMDLHKALVSLEDGAKINSDDASGLINFVPVQASDPECL